jgi:hypothetical protein
VEEEASVKSRFHKTCRDCGRVVGKRLHAISVRDVGIHNATGLCVKSHCLPENQLGALLSTCLNSKQKRLRKTCAISVLLHKFTQTFILVITATELASDFATCGAPTHFIQLFQCHSVRITVTAQCPSSQRELYRPSYRRLAAKLVPPFVHRGCRVVSMTDPFVRILGFLDRSH